MAETKIEWTGTPHNGVMLPGYTFNSWIGCHKVSEGCKNCYAEADMDNRRGRVKWGVNGSRSVTSYSYWRQALSWNNQAAAAGQRRKVFCSSLADVFEDWGGQVIDSHKQPLWWRKRWVENKFTGDTDCDIDGIPKLTFFTEQYLAKDDADLDEWQPLTLDIIRWYLFKLMEMTPHLDWLLLTKRPENIMRMIPEHCRYKFPDNIWVGTTVENQEAADKRVPLLLKVPVKIKFLSCEPMLEAIDLTDIGVDGCSCNALSGLCDPMPVLSTKLSWVICGGESGPNKRLFETAWAESLMQQCSDAHTPFFMKQVDKVKPVPGHLMVRQFPRV